MHIYRLQEDYLNVAAMVNCLWPGEYREAPAVMKKDGAYYIISSFCTGWAPNQGKYATADSLDGHWTRLRLFGDETTYASQPAFILPVQLKDKTTYLYVGDRWDGKHYHNSSYIFLPLRTGDNRQLWLDWYAEVEIDLPNGIIAGIQ